MDESGRRIPGDGGVGDPVQVDGVGDSPLRPDERPAYRTDQTAGDGSTDADGASPAAEPRPWLVVGLVLLIVFFVILAWAIVQPLL